MQKISLPHLLILQIIRCIEVSTPLKNTIPSFLPSPPPSLKSTNCPNPPFLGNPPSILVFCEPPLKVGFFSEPPKY